MNEVTREWKFLNIRIPIYDNRSNPYDENDCWEYVSVMWVIDWDDIGFMNLIDMSYAWKDDQLGSWIYMYYGGKNQFKKLCNKLMIDVYEYPICKTCWKSISWSYSWNEKWPACFDCNND